MSIQIVAVHEEDNERHAKAAHAAIWPGVNQNDEPTTTKAPIIASGIATSK